MITNQLQLPKIGETGTDLTPDMDVISMDDSIPREPELIE